MGSTTVKTVVRSAATGETLFHDYRRHESRQGETVLHALQRAKSDFGIADSNMHLFMTGSGGQQLAELLGARFVQEVAAVSLAVETSYPEVRSVIELGGQDAKIILFKDDPASDNKKKIASMNDKCAGGTGAVIDKINAKLHLSVAELAHLPHKGVKLHNRLPASAESLPKQTSMDCKRQAHRPVQLMASLFEAIVLQNLSVLTRGHTLLPKVFLLGGPNAYFPGLQSAWRRGLLDLWKRKNIAVPEGASPGRTPGCAANG